MRIRDIRVDLDGTEAVLSAHLSFETRPELDGRCYFAWPADYAERLNRRPDPFVVAALPLMGVLGENLHCDQPISLRLHHNTLEEIGVFEAYFPERYRRMQLEVPAEERPGHLGAWVSFFSGGVDSLYNIAETDRRAAAGMGRAIDELWLVHGFDIPLDNLALWEEVRQKLVEAGENGLGRKVACIRTNIRQFYDPFFEWDFGYSRALGAVAKCVAASVGSVLIGSYNTYPEIKPNSSTPLSDPLMSCDEQAIYHFSCLASRQDKLRLISQRPELLQCLRVCWKNPGGQYNCGECEKCLRTRVQLAIFGVEDRCESFPGELDPGLVERIRLPWTPNEATEAQWRVWRDLLDQCEREELKPLAAAIRRAMLKSRMFFALRLAPVHWAKRMNQKPWVKRWAVKLGIFQP